MLQHRLAEYPLEIVGFQLWNYSLREKEPKLTHSKKNKKISNPNKDIIKFSQFLLVKINRYQIMRTCKGKSCLRYQNQYL